MQWSLWANAIMGLYQGEVEKRQTEDGCLDKLRKNGVIL